MKIYTLVALITIAAIFLYVEVHQALYLEELEARSGGKGYVSDEVWYVDSARNILEKIFGLRPSSPSCATLVYDNVSDVDRAIVLAPAEGIKVVDSGYSKIYAVYVCGDSDRIEKLANETHAKDIVWGWRVGDAENIDTYLNLEHPPLAKYLIALSILLLGDRPFNWRIPSIVFGVALVVLTFFIAREISKDDLIALLVTALVAVDPLVRNMSSIAMLDIFVATGSAIAVLLALRRRFLASCIAVAISACFKWSALLTYVPISFLYIKHLVSRGTRAFSDIVFEICRLGLATLFLFLSIDILVSIPLIAYVGLVDWFSNAVFGAISWHLSVKCVGPGCSSSAPWDWFLGVNTFPLYLSKELSLYAQGYVPIYIACFVLMLLAPPYLARCKPPSRDAWYLVTGLFIGYVLLWLAGSRTQYSFYAVHLAPYVNLFVVMMLVELADRNNLEVFVHSLINAFVVALEPFRRAASRIRRVLQNVFEGIWSIVLKLFE